MKPYHLWTALLIALAHFGFLMCFFAPAFSTPDAHSYFRQAQDLATHGRTYTTRSSPAQFIGVHYREGPEGKFYTKHAPGLSIFLAIAYRLFGPYATFWVNPLLCSLALMGTFFLCRLWIGPRWAWLAPALMALNPILNEHAHFGDAHAAVAFLLIWSLYGLASLKRSPSIPLGFAAGFATGMLPVVRYPEAIYLPAIALYALTNRRKDRSDSPALWAAIAGATIPICLLALRNNAAYGAPWRTGYGISGEQTGFSLFYFARNSPFFVQKLLGEGGGLVFAFGAVGISLMCAQRPWRRRGLLLAGITAPTTLLYMSYYWPPDPQSMRFLIPTFFLYALGLVWLLRLLERQGRLRIGIVVWIMIAFQAWWGVPKSFRTMAHLQREDHSLALLLDRLNEIVPPGSVLVAPQRADAYLDFAGSWRIADILRLKGERREPPPMPPGGPRTLSLPGELGEERLGGEFWGMPPPRPPLRVQVSIRDFTRELRAWAGGSRIYWVLSEKDLLRLNKLLPAGQRLSWVAELDDELQLAEWKESGRIEATHAKEYHESSEQSPAPRNGHHLSHSSRDGFRLSRDATGQHHRKLAVVS